MSSIQRGNAAHPPPLQVYLVLILVQVVSAAGLTVLYAMLSTMYREYAAQAAGVGWAVTAYLLVAATCGALCGRLGDLLGRRRIILVMLAVAGCGALISMLVPGLAGLIAGCALQGVAGALTPLDIGLARESLPERKVPFAVGVITAAGICGSGIVFLSAGWVTDHYATHGAFVMKAILAALAFAAVLLLIPPPAGEAAALPRIDLWRGLLFAPAIAGVLVGIDRAKLWGWVDWRSAALIGSSLLLLAYWARHQARETVPLLGVRLLLQRQILLANAAQVLVGLGCIQVGQALSLFWQQPASTGTGFGLSATGAGWLFLMLHSTSSISSPWSGRLTVRFGARRAALCGAAIVIVAWTAMAASHAQLWTVIAAALVNITGLAILQAAIYNLIVEAAPPARTSEAAGMAYVFLTVAMAVGSQLLFRILDSSRVVDAAQNGASFPSDRAFTGVFVYIALSCVLCLGVLLAIPRRAAAAQAGAALGPAQ